MSSLPITPPSARAGTGLGKSSAPPPPGASGDFAALLTQTSARTAHAEGPKTRPHQEPRRDAAASRRDDGDDAKAATAAKQDDAATQAAQAQQPAKPDEATPGQPQQPQGDAQPGEGEQPPADPAAAAIAAQLAAAQAATTGAGAPATAATGAAGTPQPAVGADGLPADAQALLAQAADGQPVADPDAQGAEGKLQIPAELLDAKGQAHAGGHGKDFTKDGARPDLPPAPTLPPTADVAAAAPATAQPGAGAPAPAPAAQAAPAATPGPVAQGQPTATPLTQVPTAEGSPHLTKAAVVQTAERVQELVRIATTRNGQARATLQLKPEALGQVDVHLRTTREGLVATIAAHDQAGLDALQQAGNDLKRLLEDRGVQLHSLDLQLNAGADSGSGFGRDAGDAESSRSGAASSYGLDAGDDEVVDEAEIALAPAPLTTTSALVDVTA